MRCIGCRACFETHPGCAGSFLSMRCFLMPLGKLPHPGAHVKKSRLNTQSANFPRFPGESRDPSLRHSELLKAIAIRCQRGWARAAERKAPAFAGEAFEIAMDDSLTRSQDDEDLE